MSEPFQITVAQCVSRVGSVDENLALAAILCEQAKREGSKMVLFPETHATGHSYGNLYPLVSSTAEPMKGGNCSALERDFGCAWPRRLLRAI